MGGRAAQRRFALAFALAAALALLVSARTLGTTPTLVSSPEASGQLVFDRAVEGGIAGRTSLVISTNAGPRTFTLGFITERGAELRVREKLPSRLTEVVTVAGQLRRDDSGAGLLIASLRVGLTEGTDPERAAGLLVIRTGEKAPLTVAITPVLAEFEVQPAEVHAQATRWLGPLTGDGDDAVSGGMGTLELVGEAGTALTPIDIGGALISSENGAQLRVHVTPEPGENDEASSERLAATVSAEAFPRTGRYSGSVPLAGSGETANAVTVEVSVQDGIIWPFLTVLLGAGLGYALTRGYEGLRRRRVLRAAAKQLRGRYDKANTGLPADGPRPYALGTDVIGEGKFPRFFGRRGADSKGLVAIVGETYSLLDNEEYTDLLKRYRGLEAQVLRWIAVANALSALHNALKQYNPPDEAFIAIDAGRIEVDASIEPQSEQEADDLVAQLGRQASLLEVYGRLSRAWARLPDDVKQELQDHQPDFVYTGQGAEPAASASRTRRLLESFAYALSDVETALRAAAATARGRLERVAIPRSPAGVGVDLFKRIFAAPQLDAERVLASVRRWDFITAALIALVTVAAYLLPGYIGKDWGSWDDYVTAFTAGFIGQALTGGLVINWDLFPTARSYRPPAPVPGPPAK